ncbi:MAG: hypothetical protein JNG86_20210 [Verrucomicrobiaceae bacterium]|nr:hypothetical protein [Verrucomicrobiaceae bacterium]
MYDGLRGVQIDRGVNEGQARASAASMGELTGLALRGLGGCPCEVDLVPDAIFAARDASRRAPALVMAGLCLFAALGASIVWCQKAQAAIEGRYNSILAEGTRLQQLGRSIQGLESQQAELTARSAQLEQTVKERSWWVRLLNDLNKTFTNDVIWLTVIEPLKDGKPLTAPLWSSTNEEEKAANADAKPAAFELRIQGLYRKNSEGDQQVVNDYAAKLAKMEYFDAPDFETKRDNYVITLDTGATEDSFAYRFELKFPLKNCPQFK